MISLSTADKALKTLYLGVITNQLNTKTNAFLGKIEQSTANVWGKNIVRLVPYGVNGGVGAGSETGDLPAASGNLYVNFTTTLKNLYGTIDISDKALRASENNAGAFVNLLNSEMEGLLKASKFHFSRMLYGNGSGKLGVTVANPGNTDRNLIKFSNVRNFLEGMLIDVYADGQNTPIVSQRRILAVDHNENTVKIDGTAPSELIGANYFATLQNSKDSELTGLESLFNMSGLVYGLNRATYKFLNPYIRANAGAIHSGMIQEAIDKLEEVSASDVDFISTSYDVRRFYLDYLAMSRTNIDYMNLDGGFKAISYNGIPVIAERFVDNGTMYLLSSKDFKIHQLCDWRWLEGEEGKVLTQKPGTATFTATLVKYADMICDKPGGQGKITGITAASA